MCKIARIPKVVHMFIVTLQYQHYKNHNTISSTTCETACESLNNDKEPRRFAEICALTEG